MQFAAGDLEPAVQTRAIENPQTYSSRDRSYWRDTRNDPSLKRPRSPGDIPESLDSGHPRLVMKESANRRESAWAKKDTRQTTTLKVAAHLPAALTKR